MGLVYLDFETASTSGRIVEVGALIKKGVNTFPYYTYVNPGHNITEKDFKYNNIKMSDVFKLEDFNVVYTKLLEMSNLPSALFVAWGDQDLKLFNDACSRNGVKSYIRKDNYFNAQKLYKFLYPGMKHDLESAHKRSVFLDGGKYHTAYYDVKALRDILSELLYGEHKDKIPGYLKGHQISNELKKYLLV